MVRTMPNLIERSDFMAEYVAGRGTTALGIIGTVLGGLGVAGNGGVGLLNGGMNTGGCCSENTMVNRYELNMERELSRKEAEIAYLNGQNETNKKLTDVYANLEGQIGALRDTVYRNREEQNCVNNQQAVYNGVNTATISCIQGQVNSLLGLSRLVIPNTSICPGYGDVTITPAAAPTTGA